MEGTGSTRARVLVVGRMPNSGRFQDALELELKELGLDISDIYFTSALKCRNFEVTGSNGDVKTCRPYLEDEIARIKPEFILTMGNEALLSVLGKSGITKYRGRVYEAHGAQVIPTISPSAVMRNPGQKPGYMADLRLFANLVLGRKSESVLPKYHIIDTPEKLKKLERILHDAELVCLDVETHDEYWKHTGKIISLSATCIIKKDGKERIFCWALPLYHAESPFQRTWKSVLKFLAGALCKARRVVAHNGKYDEKWLRQFGVPVTVTFDTMLAIHLLNENVQKGLKPQAMARLGVAPWGVDTKHLLQMPLAEVLEYNFLDTYYMYLVYLQVRQEIIDRPRQARLMQKLIMPANADLVRSEMRGVWLDVKRMSDRKPVVQAELERIEQAILSYLPAPDDPVGGWPTDKKGRPVPHNFNASNFARWMLFEYLQLPILERGKDKDDGGLGDPSMREGVLMELRHEHAVVELMLERVKWQKYLSSFFNAYEEMYDEDHRVHTNFKLAGTVTGRLSSGKTDEDKITGVKGKVRGVNMQQVPRDPLVRGLFGAPPGWVFVEADYSQIELRIAAFLARELNMLHIYSMNGDIHTETAMRVTGLPKSEITGEIRKKVGKPVNFGFLYGMGWAKFIKTAFENYGAVFSEYEARAARTAYFDLFPRLPAWHERQRRLVREHGRVQSPLGRVRHLPDIYSPEQGVRAEAERQAINSPVQGFASDMALFSMVRINRALREQGLAANCIGLVHDAVNFEVRQDAIAQVLPIIKDTMEDVLPLERTFGIHVDVPIVADLKIGKHWGDSKELSTEQVYDWKPEFFAA